jgi:nicotinamide-nucleotide amidase
MQLNNYALSQQLGTLLKSKKLKLAVAESCTGGGLSQQLTAVPGSAEWFDRGFVTYSNEAKMELLKVQESTLKKYGAVSEETASEMALGALANSCSQITLSITGIAGPTGDRPGKPIGLVWFGLALEDGSCTARMRHFYSGRQHVCQSSIQFALNWLIEAAQKN